jgi:hypothetical protein
MSPWFVESGQVRTLQSIEQPDGKCSNDVEPNDSPQCFPVQRLVRESEVEEQEAHFDAELHPNVPEFFNKESLETHKLCNLTASNSSHSLPLIEEDAIRGA